VVRRCLTVLVPLAAVLATFAGTAGPAQAGVGGRVSPAKTTTPVLYNLGGGTGAVWNLAQRRPAIFYLAADGSAALGDKAHHLKWTKWNTVSGAATGKYYYRTGPCCKYHSEAVAITVSHVVEQRRNKKWYDRMTIRFSNSKYVTLRYERIDGFGFWKTVAGRFP
jgi:hypothetical protein